MTHPNPTNAQHMPDEIWMDADGNWSSDELDDEPGPKPFRYIRADLTAPVSGVPYARRLNHELQNVHYNGCQSDTLKERGKEWLWENIVRLISCTGRAAAPQYLAPPPVTEMGTCQCSDRQKYFRSGCAVCNPQPPADVSEDERALLWQYIENGKSHYNASNDIMYLEVSLDTYNSLKKILLTSAKSNERVVKQAAALLAKQDFDDAIDEGLEADELQDQTIETIRDLLTAAAKE